MRRAAVVFVFWHVIAVAVGRGPWGRVSVVVFAGTVQNMGMSERGVLTICWIYDVVAFSRVYPWRIISQVNQYVTVLGSGSILVEGKGLKIRKASGSLNRNALRPP